MYVFDMFYCTTCMNKDDDDDDIGRALLVSQIVNVRLGSGPRWESCGVPGRYPDIGVLAQGPGAKRTLLWG